MSTFSWSIIQGSLSEVRLAAAPTFHEVVGTSKFIFPAPFALFEVPMLNRVVQELPTGGPKVRSAMQPHPDRKQQLFGVDGLGEIIGCAGLEAFLPVALHCLGGQRDDREPPEARV